MNKSTNKKEEFYTPGVCNINPPESAYRKKFGHVFLGLTAAALIATLVFDLNYLMSGLVFVTAFLSAISLLQSKNNFCVAYAASGKFNNSGEYAKTSDVSDEASRKKDKQKSNKMYLQAVVIAILASLIGIYLKQKTGL